MILISGATGNVGKELVGFLLAKDERIRVLVRDKQKAAMRGDRVETTVGDLDRPATLAVAMRGIDRSQTRGQTIYD